ETVGVAVDDVAAAARQGARHVANLLLEGRVIDRGLAARVPVVLEIVDAPRGPLLRVVVREEFLAVLAKLARVQALVPLAVFIIRTATDMAGVRRDPGRRVDADL